MRTASATAIALLATAVVLLSTAASPSRGDLPIYDCTMNGVPDHIDILNGTEPDEDGNGIPDICAEMRWRPVAATGNVVCLPGQEPCDDEHIILAEGGVRVTLFLQVAGWGFDDSDDRLIGAYQGSLDSDTLLGGHSSGEGTLPGVDLVPVGAESGRGFYGAFQALRVCTTNTWDPFEAFYSFDPLSECRKIDCGISHPLCGFRPDYVFHELENTPTVSTATPNYTWSAASTECAGDGLCSRSKENCTTDSACPTGETCEEIYFYGGTLLLEVPAGARGTYNVNHVDDSSITLFNFCAGPLWVFFYPIHAQITIATGRCCSSIGAGTTVCEDNVYRTECDSRPGPRLFTALASCDPGEDCNDNGIPDECDLIDGTREDCNTNGVPDECELDRDGDSVIDVCDGCPDDPHKTEPGLCGCGADDAADNDNDGVPDCIDQCPGVDDAVFAPDCDGAVPTVSAWGLVAMTLLLLTVGKVYFRRQAILN